MRSLTVAPLPHGLTSLNTNHRLRLLYEVEGPWNFNDPVHEQITQKALQKAGIITAGTSYDTGIAWEYIRGVYWNDDPELLLFDGNDDAGDFSSGIKFAFKWKIIEEQVKQGAWFGPGTTLLGRSHYGDLQCLHSMASKNREEPSLTRQRIFDWLEALYNVSVGRISDNAQVSSVLGGRLLEYFPESGMTFRELLLGKCRGVVRQRAIGICMHIIQDSFAIGHVERDKERSIVEFHCYSDQDADKHAAGDKLVDGSIDNVTGASEAVDACATILNYYIAARSWKKVKVNLDEKVFKLSPNARASGPGNDFSVKAVRPQVLGSSAAPVSFIYHVTGNVFDYDPEADWGIGDHEQATFDWGKPVEIFPGGDSIRFRHECIVDNEVELQLDIVFRMNLDLELEVLAFFELLEGSSQMGRTQIHKGTVGNTLVKRESSVTIYDGKIGRPDSDHVIVTNEE